MSKIAYVDCPTGISGDMFLAACIDAGLNVEELVKELKKLDVAGYEIDSGKKDKNGLCGQYFKVLIEKQHHHRSWQDIKKIIEKSELTLPVKKKSISVFNALAIAEARVHGVAKEEVHFHEVGAVDSIVDIVGAAIAVDLLRIKKLYVSPLPMGHGWVKAAHGQIPLPAPATLALLENCPVYPLPVASELVTPTGAAIAVALADGFSRWPHMTIQKVGFGAGGLNFQDRANILRLAIGEELHSETVMDFHGSGAAEAHNHHHPGHAHDDNHLCDQSHSHSHEHIHHMKHHEHCQVPALAKPESNRQTDAKQNRSDHEKNAQHG